MAFAHTTVLLNEAIDALVADPAGTFVDGTFGRGGHSRLLLARLAPAGRLFAFDKDPEAIAAATTGEGAIADPRFTIPKYMGHNGWIAFAPGNKPDWDEVAELARQSYRHFALKRMLKQIDAP